MVSCAALGLEGVSEAIKSSPCSLRQLWRKVCCSEDPFCYLLVSLEARKHFPVLNTNLRQAVKKQDLQLILSFQYSNGAYKIHNLYKKERE